MTANAAGTHVMIGTVLQGSGVRYHVVELIGEGGQGWVFKASYDDVDGFPVVVKVLRPDTATRDALDRFKREADILRRLSQLKPSPYIVRFYDHGEASVPLPNPIRPGEHATLPFTVLEYVHGESLFAVLERTRGVGLPVRRARRIGREVAKALETVHAEGIVHRDLKPSNILISNEAGREVAKVTDFGLVKLVDTRATATQALAGVSLAYAPPEQYEPGNARVGTATDVFSFAAIVFELLAGREAFPAGSGNPFEALRLIATAPRPRLSERLPALAQGLRERPDLVGRIDQLLERALSPEPSLRPQSLKDFWDSIDPLLRESEGSSTHELAPVRMASEATRPGMAEPYRPAVAAVTPPEPAIGTTPQGELLHPFEAPPGTLPTRGAGAGAPPPQAAPHAGHAAHGAHALDPSDPRAWSWRTLAHGTPGAQVRSAVFDEGSVLTLGAAGLVRFSPGSGWATVSPSGGVTPQEMRAISRLSSGALVFAGERGLVGFVHGGAFWDVRRYPDHDVLFHAVAADASGSRVIAVGERVSRGHAFAAELTSQGFRRTFELTDIPPLRGVGFLDGHAAIACGDVGGLVQIEEAGVARIAWERTGHLRAVAHFRARLSHGHTHALAVGTGGHALAIMLDPARGLRTEIEKVMTTQDLLAVAVGPDGAAWATSANARVLRRDAAGTWHRVTTELPTTANLVAIAPRQDHVLVVGEDATVLEGRRVG
jgi:serine/threonine-protein kinase